MFGILYLQAEKHVQIRQDAEQRYMAMLERACKMLADQFISATVMEPDNQKVQDLGSKAPRGSLLDSLGFYSLPTTGSAGMHVLEGKMMPTFERPRTGCSTESCITSHESSNRLASEGSPGGGKKRVLNLDPMAPPLMWSEAKMRVQVQDINMAQGNIHGLTRYGM